jgi:hypothetical protein
MSRIAARLQSQRRRTRAAGFLNKADSLGARVSCHLDTGSRRSALAYPQAGLLLTAGAWDLEIKEWRLCLADRMSRDHPIGWSHLHQGTSLPR